MSKRIKRVLVVLLAAVLACCVGFLAYAGDYYRAGAEAAGFLEAASSAEKPMQVTETPSEYAVGDPSATCGLVLYPGAKVEPAAYVPLACDLAERGVFCVVVKMPFNFAFFDMDAASRVMAEYPQTGTWWVGGHSLGGAMAAQFAGKNARELAGVVLLGAYSAADLSQTDLRVEVIYGSEDSVLSREKLASCESNLPADTRTLVIEGGNHAGFADYGPQSGDGEATILPQDQQAQAVDEIARAMLA